VLNSLLQATVTTFVSPTASVLDVERLPVQSGNSGAAVHRYQVTLELPSGSREQVRLVTKEAGLLERRVLAWLTAQGQKNVPFSHSLDFTTDGPALVCQQDVGDTYRPTSLEPITAEAIREEAAGLAAIHHANLRNSQQLAWLPRVDRTYFSDFVVNRCWQPYWQQALTNPDFRRAAGRGRQ
jgi:hypothetical protein